MKKYKAKRGNIFVDTETNKNLGNILFVPDSYSVKHIKEMKEAKFLESQKEEENGRG